ncbi:MAG: hypothetical protein O2779_03250 [Nanoarchaeota archaeon]|nr:hypothetical protein [Nanoarchaeota archaeon]
MRGFRLFPVVLFLIFLLVGCQTTGQAYLNPSGDVLFDVARTVDVDAVTLEITNALSGGSDLVVIVERLPDGYVFVDGSYSLAPSILNDNQDIAMWILSPSAQSLTQFSIAGGIPASITYSYTGGALDCSAITGKYGVDDGGAEPYEDTTRCVSDNPASCVSCPANPPTCALSAQIYVESTCEKCGYCKTDDSGSTIIVDPPVVSCVSCPAVTSACAQGDVFVEDTCNECGHCETGSSNVPTISDLTKAVTDYLEGIEPSISVLTDVITRYLNQ